MSTADSISPQGHACAPKPPLSDATPAALPASATVATLVWQHPPQPRPAALSSGSPLPSYTTSSGDRVSAERDGTYPRCVATPCCSHCQPSLPSSERTRLRSKPAWGRKGASSAAAQQALQKTNGCNRLQNALNDKSRLRLIKASDFSFSCAEAESVVGKVHEQDGKVEALVYLYMKLTDPSSFDGLLDRTLKWKEDRETVQTRVAALGDDGAAGGKTVGGGAVGVSLSASSEFERAVPLGYNAPTAVRDASAKVEGIHTSIQTEQQRAARARSATADALAEEAAVEQELAAVAKAIETASPVSPPEPESAPAGFFSLSELQSGCPAGVDPLHKELSLDPAAFPSALGASAEDFMRLPKWKQSAAKKKAGLF